MAQEAEEGQSVICLDSLNAGFRSTNFQGQQGEPTKEEKQVSAIVHVGWADSRCFTLVGVSAEFDRLFFLWKASVPSDDGCPFL